jgi:hypothetical protein
MRQYWSGFVSNKGCQLHRNHFLEFPARDLYFLAGKRWLLPLYHRQLLRYERGAAVSDGKKIGIAGSGRLGKTVHPTKFCPNLPRATGVLFLDNSFL